MFCPVPGFLSTSQARHQDGQALGHPHFLQSNPQLFMIKGSAVRGFALVPTADQPSGARQRPAHAQSGLSASLSESSLNIQHFWLALAMFSHFSKHHWS